MFMAMGAERAIETAQKMAGEIEVYFILATDKVADGEAEQYEIFSTLCEQ